jgi:hypothetical protein
MRPKQTAVSRSMGNVFRKMNDTLQREWEQNILMLMLNFAKSYASYWYLGQ